MNSETITAVALGIGLSASCGFRVFVPLLVASIAARAGIVPLQENFLWLGSWPAIICFGVATISEILAYYIPFVDNLLDMVTTPLAIGAGSLLMTSVLPIDSEMLKWVTGIIIGGGTAATIQGGSVISRLGSSKLTAGIGNPVVATGEHIAAIGTSVLSLLLPVFIALVFLILTGYLISRFGRKVFSRR